MNLFRTKSIAKIQADAAAGMTEHEQEEIGGEGGGLRRTLGQFDLTLMGIAAIIGAGIFAMVGKASFDGGPAVIFLFIFSFSFVFFALSTVQYFFCFLVRYGHMTIMCQKYDDGLSGMFYLQSIKIHLDHITQGNYVQTTTKYLIFYLWPGFIGLFCLRNGGFSRVSHRHRLGFPGFAHLVLPPKL